VNKKADSQKFAKILWNRNNLHLAFILY